MSEMVFVLFYQKKFLSKSKFFQNFQDPLFLRGSVHTQTATLNVKLTFVGVWVKMPDVRVVAEMSKTNFQNTMRNNSNKK